MAKKPAIDRSSQDRTSLTTLDYAERKPRAALWVDLFLGALAVTTIVPLAGFIAYRASHMAAGNIILSFFLVTVALAGFGFGVWCIHTSINAWRKRNVVEPPMPARVYSLRWRW